MPLALGAWEVARSAAGEHPRPGGTDGLSWQPATVPGTTAGAAPDIADPDAWDWWYRASLQGGDDEAGVLVLEGLATIAEVFVDGERVLESRSMFVAHSVPVTGPGELAICFRALAPLLAQRYKPRARWRTRLVADGNLRWFRTSLIGRTPGFSPVTPITGPWRPVRVEPAAPRLAALRVRTRLEGDDGVVEIAGVVEGAAEVEVAAGGNTNVLAAGADGAWAGSVRLTSPARWWPHTHGEPALHDVVVRAGATPLARRRVGFRTLAPGPRAAHDVLEDGLDLHVNGVRVFARGALWTHVAEQEIRDTLGRAREAGMNMIRIPGTGVYEPAVFHDACDELGLLVWQDFMFANLDYPVSDAGFRALVQVEAEQQLELIAHRPSLAVLCGNSEVEQQVTMLGLDPELGRGELFAELLPEAARRAGSDAVYLTSAPTGSGLPIRPDRGVANWFGVGGYRRPIEDVRRAGVRFASECLALANVPAEDPAERTAGVPRDVGAGWDFADVRDHYLQALYGVDPAALLREYPARYYELSRAVGGDVMAEVLGEWRRAGSACGGALILCLRDVVPGSGWGILDADGMPKPVWHALRGVLAPVALWSTDEGLGGIALQLANDGPDAVTGTLRAALYRDQETLVGEASETLTLPPHGAAERNVEDVLGRFVDAAWAYRFGPPQQDLVVGTFDVGQGAPLQTLRFPAGRPSAAHSAAELGLEAQIVAGELILRSRRLVHGVRVAAEGVAPQDAAFSIAPGAEWRIGLAQGAGARVRALNLQSTLVVTP